ncbi:MAG: glycosyltransferase, dolichyl-phosphate beta-glucosyltransferase, partial [Microgenomates group bacterium GW2011_GWC1_41_8]
MNLSIIIPFFNEQSRFSKTVKYIRDFLDTQKFFDDIELIFVDDGSTDNTRGLIDEFAKQISIKTIAYKKNMGKGYAVRQGMMAAKSDYALFLDADMSTEPEEIEKFMAEIKKGTPVIIGSRRSKGSQV